MRNFPKGRKWCRWGEFDREVVLVYMMAVVNIMECHWCLGENIKVGWVGLPQTLSGEDAVDGNGHSADGFIPQTMQDLIAWRVFEISMEFEIDLSTRKMRGRFGTYSKSICNLKSRLVNATFLPSFNLTTSHTSP